jgi:hypothetical protein
MLDILTEKGQATVQQEQRAIEIWHSHYPNIVYNETPKNKPCSVDAILTKDGKCSAVVETKCRTMTHTKFNEVFGHDWLVTLEKVLSAKKIAEELHIPLLGFLYLVNDDMLLWKKIWDPELGWCAPFRVEKTETKATVNGGTAIRDNAYINMADCNMLRYNDDRRQTDK